LKKFIAKKKVKYSFKLPETQEERKKLKHILDSKFLTWCWTWAKSDVEGQNWKGKMFIEIPFGIDLKEEIVSLMKG